MFAWVFCNTRAILQPSRQIDFCLQRVGFGAELLRNLAIIYAWTGEKDLALKQLEELLPLYGPISYGQLRLHPWWDQLRDDPRFEKIIEEAKKPVALK
jgi:hypothetical protein